MRIRLARLPCSTRTLNRIPDGEFSPVARINKRVCILERVLRIENWSIPRARSPVLPGRLRSRTSNYIALIHRPASTLSFDYQNCTSRQNEIPFVQFPVTTL